MCRLIACSKRQEKESMATGKFDKRSSVNDDKHASDWGNPKYIKLLTHLLIQKQYTWTTILCYVVNFRPTKCFTVFRENIRVGQ